MLKVFVCLVVKVLIDKDFWELYKNTKSIKIVFLEKTNFFGTKVDNGNRFNKTSNLVFVV